MKSFINKYHLKTGFLVAVIFPGIFVFSDNEPTNIVNRFVTSFIIIFSLWIINFTIVDFNNAGNQNSNQTILNKYGRIAVSFVLAILIYVVIAVTLDRSGSLLSQLSDSKKNSFNAWFFLCLRIVLFNAMIILIKYLFDTHAEKRKVALENEVLKRENLNALHEILKQQVNPHFLFNSLNTLKSLTKRDPEQAASFISELSTVYRYMLLHRDKTVVSLKEEIDFLKSYLYLLKIRFGDAIHTQILIPDELLESTMPPNTLQLLIENAVKHNALSHKKPLSIFIFIKENYLAVENNLQPKTEHTASSRLGLNNISSRYLLLKGKDIIIQKNEKSFQVLLPIN